jgi:cytochrome c5
MTIKKINNIRMNKIIFFGACFSLLIACSPKTTQTGAVVEPVTKTLSASALQGQTIYTEKCGACHKLFKPEKFSEAKWRHEVPEMAKLAKISAEDENLVLTYVLESIK